MKHEWRKSEKQLYLPKPVPQLISVPSFSFFTIEGSGNPNHAFFDEYIKVLYSLSYGIKMTARKVNGLQRYFDYTVYPLEGVWDLNEHGRQAKQEVINKDDLVFTLMIRQPDFVTVDFANEVADAVYKKKPHSLLKQVKFESITEGNCIQMLHLGSYDNELASFAIMERYATQEKYIRLSKIHREIYLSDVRKVSPEKLKTVLRFSVAGNSLPELDINYFKNEVFDLSTYLKKY